MSPNLEENLIELSSADGWREILNLSDRFTIEEKSRFLWAWPTEVGLKRIEKVLLENGVSKILSIGCGSGLLEWLINASTRLDVVGIELDNAWWKSSYSPRTFIDLHYTDAQVPSASFLYQCIGDTPQSYALMFCYFNNRTAFLDYVRAYRGQFVVIIGPKDGCNIVTDPTPMNPQFEEDETCCWRLETTIDMESKQNCLAVYRRSQIDQ